MPGLNQRHIMKRRRGGAVGSVHTSEIVASRSPEVKSVSVATHKLKANEILMGDLRKVRLSPTEGVTLPENVSYRLECYDSVASLPVHLKKPMFDLVERNMKSLYERSQWGWNSLKKMFELTDKTQSRYLMILDESNDDTLVAFTHYRLVVDSNDPVLYCYELQVDQGHQRLGLGLFLMSCLDRLAEALEGLLTHVRLTVFPFNHSAMQFYTTKLGFKVHSSSPPAYRSKYLILSKRVPCSTGQSSTEIEIKGSVQSSTVIVKENDENVSPVPVA